MNHRNTKETLEVLHKQFMPSYFMRRIIQLDYRLEKLKKNYDQENLKSLNELYAELKVKTKKEKK